MAYDNTFYEPVPKSSLLTTTGTTPTKISGSFSAYKVYSYGTNGQKHYLIYPDTTSSWDYLKMFKVKSTYTYTASDFQHGNWSNANISYYNVASAPQLEAAVSVVNTYETFNSGKYYRLKSTLSTKQRPGESDSKAKNVFEFINANSSRVSKQFIYYFTNAGVEDTDVDTISYTYSTQGNVTGQTYQLGNIQRTASSAFDTKGRFTTSVTNAIGHTYNIVINDNGQIISQQEPNGNTVSNAYNGLGQIIQINNIDESDQTITTAWVTTSDADAPAYSVYYTLVSTTARPYIKTYYDALGHALRTVSEAQNNKLVFVDAVYNNKGQQVQVSLPYFKGETIHWNYTTYYNDGRLATQYTDNNIKKLPSHTIKTK